MHTHSGMHAAPAFLPTTSLPARRAALPLRPRRRARAPPAACLAPPPRPLADRRVVATAPQPYAARLLSRLSDAHARPVHLPTISTTPLGPGRRDELDDAVLRLSDYALVAFPSRVAIASFAAALRGIVAGDAAAASLALRASAVATAALGADAAALRDQLAVGADLLPVGATPAALAAEIAADPDRWAGARVLVPVPRVVGMAEPDVIPDFLAALRAAGVHPAPVPAYETAPLARARVAPELAWLVGSGVDALVVSSVGEALALDSLLQPGERDALLAALRDGRVVLAAHGPVTADGMRAVFPDVKIVVSRDPSTFQGVVTALEDEFARRERESGRLELPV